MTTTTTTNGRPARARRRRTAAVDPLEAAPATAAARTVTPGRSTVAVSFRLQPAIMDALDARALEEGMTRTAYLSRLLCQDLGLPLSAARAPR